MLGPEEGQKTRFSDVRPNHGENKGDCRGGAKESNSRQPRPKLRCQIEDNGGGKRGTIRKKQSLIVRTGPKKNLMLANRALSIRGRPQRREPDDAV